LGLGCFGDKIDSTSSPSYPFQANCQTNTIASVCKAPFARHAYSVTDPFTHVAIDIIGPLPKAKESYKFLLNYICLASRYPEALP